jgi:putative nucleotidyltransferase with HDIG domain
MKTLESVTSDDAVAIVRPRIAQRLDTALSAPITILMGPSGCGKSVALRGHGALTSALRYRAGSLGGTLVSFVRGFARAVAEVSPGAQTSFARAWERGLQSGSPEAALAHWMCEHLAQSDATIIIDDLHDATENPSVAAFIAKFAELRSPRRTVLCARVPGLLPVALWLATRMMDRPIDEAELRFVRADVEALAASMGQPISAAQAQTIIAGTGGLAVAVRYALARYGASDGDGFDLVTSDAQIVKAILARRSDAQRELLYICSMLPVVHADVLAALGWPDLAGTIEAMVSDAPFIWDVRDGAPVRLRDGARAYVATALSACDDEHRILLALRVVRTLDATEHYADALTVAAQQCLPQALRALVDAHGFAILESGQIDVISEAMALIDGSKGGVATALLGYLESALGRLDTSEAWFALGLETAQTPLSRATIAFYYARELMYRRRPDACDILEPYIDADLPLPLAIDLRSSYAQALLIGGRIDEATRRTDEAVAMVGPGFAPAAHARVLVRAAYVALESGAIEIARERAHAAVPLALSESLYDAATSAYSVLYNIASAHDDDAFASMHYVRLLREAGAKAGTLRSDLYAAMALYELHAEAGDTAELARLDREIESFDVHYATPEVTEGLLPAKALQAGWAGEFAAARAMLLPTAEHQATSERKAQRWAEVALYAAAAGDASGGAHALDMANFHLAGDVESPIKREATFLILGLCSWVVGDAPRANDYLARGSTLTGRAPRIGALRAALTCLLADGAENERLALYLPARLRELRALAYGGMARLIEALPYHVDGRPATIGDALARRDHGATSSAIARAIDAARLHAPHPRDVALPIDEIDAQIESLISELDQVAPLMAEHSRAVSAWCGRIARKLGLDAAEITHLMRCGLIHDVGKIMTPSAILHAPRRLSLAEWAVMKTHVNDGAAMVANVSALVPFVPIVRGHHERIDGHGYPDGLHTTAIPLAARIVTVADSFNAMIGRRTYQLPRAPTDALEELYRHSHSQFDPEVVDAMAQVVMGSTLDGEVIHAHSIVQHS